MVRGCGEPPPIKVSTSRGTLDSSKSKRKIGVFDFSFLENAQGHTVFWSQFFWLVDDDVTAKKNEHETA